MINYIFVFVFLVAIIYACLTKRVDVVVQVILDTPKSALILFADIYALLIFWGGMLEICKNSGLLALITNYVSYVVHPFFKKLDRKSEAMQYICLNIVANMLSMGSAATPFGLKAMKELDELNNHSEVASDEMITFLLINTSGLCMIPTILISLRKQYGSSNPVSIIPYIFVVSSITTIFSVLVDWLVRRRGKH
ncbi:MAG: hypothetical protein K2H02_00415 [Anaeroplasmataceae bacterium]|nr:hypothetical protein [Anaeroplasmataceae bacterium]MDE5867388.1 hypothetical protein [Anaeroplasmataceae bacterium]